ncbi:hypothetical protein WS62_06840 [Burkholderia sp. ABCPW 14]|uniref:hypothetical protein n=1 Tax=Burkholderia sp. ABCPW 14 TaxID=1637860 RepID=UPI000770D74C|nr:hypothetical protein [Burkholderia sp. ABCPW 14]KVD74177.1 hypothetical protein WS62_06840 [Burkholderia sp. ABCPW 14]
MSIPKIPIQNAPERPEDPQTAAERLRVSAPSGVAPSITPAGAPPDFSSASAVVADMRKEARARAQQMVVEAKQALLESLHALHTTGYADAASGVAAPASKKRGER